MLLTRRGLQRAFLYGLISGLFLAALLKIIEHITRFKVYTLLLNVDYIPYIKTFVFPELVEVGFHLIVSIALSICLYLMIINGKISSSRKIIVLCTFVSFIIGVAIFPTTTFSDRTPAFTSIPSFSYWIVGHIMYGCIMGILFARYLTKEKGF
ncbi:MULTISPECIES: hypothetical protein [unclassified Sporosarcina]|uniref:hypothetical protein n=1 Tax=unclassified Sporosarcina TaxID=2647733 RepID=UPI00164DC8F1|nr:hypothetical protein [Sporosarcina sp. resist]QNK89904.1 hypothetical protein H7992_09770 [Sporosarcina sp. resist]